MSRIDSQLKRYYRLISATLPCGKKMKQEILSQLKGSVRQYLQQNPDADFAAVQKHFGTPEQIAAGYVEDQASDSLIKGLNSKKRLITIVACALAVILLIWTALMVWAAWDSRNSEPNYVDVEIVED